MPKNICIYSGSANPQLSREIANYLGVPLGKVNLQRFPDGEAFCQYEENVRRADVFIIQPTCAPTNDNLMELLIMLDAAKRASAARITAVLPYYGYARQDRKDRPRVPISAKLVANLITVAGADRVITLDLHSQQIQGFFDIPVDNLYARPVLSPYLHQKLGSDVVVVSPDSGSVKMAQTYCDSLDAGLAVIAKRRISATAVATSHLVGDVKGHTCVITDDMTSTAGTLCAAADKLKAEGASKVFAAISHCVLNDEGYERLKGNTSIEEMVATDSIPVNNTLDGRIKVLSVAPLLGEAIKRIHEGVSVSTLFRIKK